MKNISFLIALLFLFSCQHRQEKAETVGFCPDNTCQSDSICYAQGFRIEKHPDYTLLEISNPWKNTQTLQTCILVPKSAKLPENLPDGVVIRTPLEKTVVFSAVVCGMLNDLDALSAVAGAAEPEYIDLQLIKQRLSDGSLYNIGQASNPDIEKLMVINPEILLTNPVNEAGAGALSKLSAPTIPCLEWMETHPLGQTEWIRLLGLLFDKQALADSLFFETVRSYNELKTLTSTVEYRPTVFAEKKYGDFWYMPGGQSYFARIMEDAGADYIFKDNPATGSVPFAFETILDKAGKAGFWLFKYYAAQDITYKQLADEYANYTLFDAYKNRNIYVCNTLKTAAYYQEIPLHPDWLLKDLIGIFHPELLPGFSLRYYEKVKE